MMPLMRKLPLHRLSFWRSQNLRSCFLPALAILCAATTTCAAQNAQERGTWHAANSTARSITGDIALANEKLLINFASFTIAEIRDLQQAELSAAFDVVTGGPGTGHLYRLNIPATQKFLRKNSLCASDNTQWMATYVAGRNLQIAFFSGQTPPVMTFDALASSTNLCGTYSYVK